MPPPMNDSDSGSNDNSFDGSDAEDGPPGEALAPETTFSWGGLIKGLQRRLSFLFLFLSEAWSYQWSDPGWSYEVSTRSLFRSYQSTGALEDIESAVGAAQDALSSTMCTDKSGLCRRHIVLASVLAARYERLSVSEDIKNAILYSEYALNSMHENHRDRCASLQAVAWVYRVKYDVEGDEGALEQAIEKYRSAMVLAAAEDKLRLRCIQGLSASLGDRYQRKGDRKDLQQALKYDHEILKLAGTDHKDRPAYLRNLASSFHDLYMDEKKSVDRKEPHDFQHLQYAIATMEEAKREMKPENLHYPECLQNLAIYLADRYDELKDPHDVRQALRYYGKSFAGITGDLNPTGDSDPTGNLNPTQSFKAALRWASLAQDHDNPENCRKAYEKVFCLLPQILWIGNSLNDHKTACKRINIADVTSKAVSAYIRNGDLKDAIKLVDQGLATALQQSMQLKTRPGECLRAEEEREMKSLSRQICDRRASLGDRRKALKQMKELIKRIRGQDDLDRFLLPRNYEQLSEAAKNGPVVILNSDGTHCDALILLRAREEPLHLELTNICEDLKNIQNIGLTPKSSVPPATRFPCTPERIPSKELPALLELLKQHITVPIQAELKKKGFPEGTRLWWCPTGIFTGLSLHAATDSTHFIHSYTLILEGNHPRRNPPNWKIGIIGVPQTDGQKKLENVENEVRQIEKLLRRHKSSLSESKVLLAEDAKIDDVEGLLSECSWIHFACHGTQDREEPQNSSLSLYDKPLNLESILGLDLPNAEFVFLSACETVTGDSTVKNEALHLCGGFLAAGFQGAIGTLWPMDDRDGSTLAEAVYDHLLQNTERPKVTEVAKALQIAVGKLRESTPDEPERWATFIHIGV